ncbi:MAG: nucleoside-diphosphate kinase [Treponema sp.]|nr:nucleoside-diphosphate kinase [Treponema sp.]
MEQSLSYVLVTPYTILKSRTGGVISRLLSRTDLELVGAQMVCLDEEFTRNYANIIRNEDPGHLNSDNNLLAYYIEHNLSPSGGRKHRSLLLVFRGEDPCSKLSNICGTIYPDGRKSVEAENVESLQGETIRDTYADLISSHENPNKVIYFEPAILTPKKQVLADKNLKLFSQFLGKADNIVSNVLYEDTSRIERTLVIIKPDNWKYASSRPGTIIDMFSKTGLRIVGIKVHRFTLRQALEFYKPVEENLIRKLGPMFGQRAMELLEREFHIPFRGCAEKSFVECFGAEYGREQFRQIIEFMSGIRPDQCAPEDMDKPGSVMCMILVYEGEDAIKKIRDVLGPTDPLKAPGGTVRREFGSSVMVNTAHASDSTESYEREKEVVRFNENPLGRIISQYLENSAKN